MSRWAICRRRTGRPTDRWRSGTRRSVRCCGTPHCSSAPPRRWWRASPVGRRKGAGGPSTGCWQTPSKWPGALLERFDPGERVAVWAPNIPEWVLLELGAGLAGMVLVTVNPAYKPKELEYVLRQSGAVGHLLGARVPGQPHGGRAWRRSAPGWTHSGRQCRSRSGTPSWRPVRRSPRLPSVQPGDPAQIQYTSGTTGFPKGALLHHRGLTNNARIFANLVGRPGRRRVRQPVPDVPHRWLRPRDPGNPAGRGAPRAGPSRSTPRSCSS